MEYARLLQVIMLVECVRLLEECKLKRGKVRFEHAFSHIKEKVNQLRNICIYSRGTQLEKFKEKLMKMKEIYPSIQTIYARQYSSDELIHTKLLIHELAEFGKQYISQYISQ
jgi:hypothetical protein